MWKKITSTKTYVYVNIQLDSKVKGKAIPLQALTGSEGCRRLRLSYFKTTGTLR
jgi:hypothetical protein